MSFVFVIAHAPHLPERKLTLARLISQLPEDPRHKTLVYSGRGEPHEWSLAQWKMGLEHDAEYVVCLNDDMIACDDLYRVLNHIVDVRGQHVVSLYNCHPMAGVADKQGYRWVTSVDGLIGNAYMMPRAALTDFVSWREALPASTYTSLSEDQLINLWCMQNEYLVWHTTPAVFDHDTSIPSAYGNTQLRSPVVGPRSPMPEDWDTDGLHTGRNFSGNHWFLATKLPWEWVKETKALDRMYALERDVLLDQPITVPEWRPKIGTHAEADMDGVRGHFYRSIPGYSRYTLDFYRDWVRQCPDGAVAVELGSWQGRSAAFLCQEAKRSGKKLMLHCVDLWESIQEAPMSGTEPFEVVTKAMFEENMAPVAGYYTAVQSDTALAAQGYADQSVDMVFIDGDHTKEGVTRDIRAWLPKVKPGGIIAGHDYGDQFPGVAEAVHAEFGRDVYISGIVWIHEVKP